MDKEAVKAVIKELVFNLVCISLTVIYFGFIAFCGYLMAATEAKLIGGILMFCAIFSVHSCLYLYDRHE